VKILARLEHDQLTSLRLLASTIRAFVFSSMWLGQCRNGGEKSLVRFLFGTAAWHGVTTAIGQWGLPRSTVGSRQPSAAKLTAMYLITGAAWASGRVSDSVVELLRGNGEPVRVMVRRDDGRANRFRELGAEVVVADLTSPVDVVEAMRDVTRMFFNTHISFDYLQEVATVCAAAGELGGLEVVVNLSQMTVAQMTLTSSEESRQQRLFWLAEQIMNWSGVPAVHVRPTMLLDNPLFTVLARRSVREHDVLALPFGTGRTSPIAAEDVARVVAALLLTPPKPGQVYGLTGPQVRTTIGCASICGNRGCPTSFSNISRPWCVCIARTATTAPLMTSNRSPVNPHRPSSTTSPRTRTCFPKSAAVGTLVPAREARRAPGSRLAVRKRLTRRKRLWRSGCMPVVNRPAP
jgi:uncharacterized protein YbjT (DUF2867 family)